jgi:hypothetical protein
MIIDYCRQNKVAITFQSNEEFKKIVSSFDDNWKDHIRWKQGCVSYYVSKRGRCTIHFNCSSLDFLYWTQDHVVLSASEFFDLLNEDVSVIELMR